MVLDLVELTTGDPNPNTVDEKESRGREDGSNDSCWRWTAGDDELVGAMECEDVVF